MSDLSTADDGGMSRAARTSSIEKIHSQRDVKVLLIASKAANIGKYVLRNCSPQS